MNPALLLIAAVGFYLFKKGPTASTVPTVPTVTPNQAEAYCINFFENERGQDGQVFTYMTDAEVLDCYRYIHDYIAAGTMISSTDPLHARILAILSKYNFSI